MIFYVDLSAPHQQSLSVGHVSKSQTDSQFDMEARGTPETTFENKKIILDFHIISQINKGSQGLSLTQKVVIASEDHPQVNFLKLISSNQ